MRLPKGWSACRYSVGSDFYTARTKQQAIEKARAIAEKEGHPVMISDNLARRGMISAYHVHPDGRVVPYGVRVL
jgi:thiamine monophosphate synthase